MQRFRVSANPGLGARWVAAVGLRGPAWRTLTRDQFAQMVFANRAASRCGTVLAAVMVSPQATRLTVDVSDRLATTSGAPMRTHGLRLGAQVGRERRRRLLAGQASDCACHQ